MSFGNSKVFDPRAAEVGDKIAQYRLQLGQLEERAMSLRKNRVRAALERLREDEEIPELERFEIRHLRTRIRYVRDLTEKIGKNIHLLSFNFDLFQSHQRQEQRDGVMQDIKRISSNNDSWIQNLENEIRVIEAKLGVV